ALDGTLKPESLNSVLLYTYAEDGTPPGTPVKQGQAVALWTYDQPLMNNKASLATLAGNYLLADGHSVATVDAQGNFTLTEPSEQDDTEPMGQGGICSLAGTVSIVDPATNVYTLNATMQTGTCEDYWGTVALGTAGVGVMTTDGTLLHGGVMFQDSSGNHASIGLEGKRQ
ncbi:MAG TPA: hypothetical protein VMF64_07160, partial [Steroidobacteraceae bacterium]|nr:hypothetical protein [Steroidobacteraceae bacterium]